MVGKVGLLSCFLFVFVDAIPTVAILFNGLPLDQWPAGHQRIEHTYQGSFGHYYYVNPDEIRLWLRIDGFNSWEQHQFTPTTKARLRVAGPITAVDEGTTWVITPDNASDYGLDWNAFDRAMNLPWNRSGSFSSIRFGWDAYNSPFSNDNVYNKSISLPFRSVWGFRNWLTDRIELSLPKFGQPTPGSSGDGTTLTVRVIGTGFPLIPEPSSASLSLIALGYLVGRRRRG